MRHRVYPCKTSGCGREARAGRELCEQCIRAKRDAKRQRAASRREGRGVCRNPFCQNLVPSLGDELCTPCIVVARMEAERAAAPQREAARIVAENAAADAAAAASTSPWELPTLTPRLRPSTVVAVAQPPPPPPEEAPLFADILPAARRIYVTPPSSSRPAADVPPPPPPPAPPVTMPPTRNDDRPLRGANADAAISPDLQVQLRLLRKRVDAAPLNTAAKKQYSAELMQDILAAAKEMIDERGITQAAFCRALNLPQPIVSNWRRAAREGLEHRNPPRGRPDDPRSVPKRRRSEDERPLRNVTATPATLSNVTAAALPPLPTPTPTPTPTKEIIMPASPPTPTPKPRRANPPNGRPAPTGDTLHKAVASLLQLEEIGAMDAAAVVTNLRLILQRMDG